MKVRASIKKRSVDCKIVRRNGKLYIYQQKEPEVQTTSGLIFY
ncbi:MAG: 50S ribosomal protein L36 [Saprospiraceae bacterium]|nr:50S ribosomal protein L36 [Saprospiraceae bacterium]